MSKQSKYCLLASIAALTLFTACEQNYWIEANGMNPSDKSITTATDPVAVSDPTDGSAAGPGTIGSGSACRQMIQNTSDKLNIVVMIDNSYSTDDTDPSRKVRYNLTHALAQDYSSHTNLRFSFAYFNCSAPVYDVQNAAFKTLPAKAFGAAADLDAAVTKFKSISTQGCTNFSIAFNQILAVINNDISAGSEGDYAIVFMADGNTTAMTAPPAMSEIHRAVESRGRQLSISTVYFGPGTEQEAINRLKSMADSADWFVDTNSVTDFKLDSLIRVPSAQCL